MALKSLIQRFFGARSVGGSQSEQVAGRCSSKRSAAKRPATDRRLVLESLEGRDLMAVATLGQTWKSLTFDAPIALNGTLIGKYGSLPVNGTFNGSLNVEGSLTYGSMNTASGQAHVVGAVDSKIRGYNGTLPTAFIDSNTGAGGLSMSAGKLTAVIPGGDSLSPITLTGAINTKDFSASGKVNFKVLDPYQANGSGNWKGSFAPTNPSPLDISLTAAFDANKFGTLDISVTCDGSVQPAPTATTAITNVVLNWADAGGNTVGTLKDKIPLFWNQASGNYEVSQLTPPPATATQVRVSVSYQGQTKSVLVPLPAHPTISIDNVSTTPPATGSGAMTFTVTLSSPTLANVVVKFATVDGTAVVKQDYVKKSGTLTFKPGGPLTQTITVSVLNDKLPGPQSFGVQLSNAVWGSLTGSGLGIGTIND